MGDLKTCFPFSVFLSAENRPWITFGNLGSFFKNLNQIRRKTQDNTLITPKSPLLKEDLGGYFIPE
jgi:hypothetical protein